MADAKLTALDALAAPAGGDLLYIVDDPSGTPLSKKVTVDAILAYANLVKRDTHVLAMRNGTNAQTLEIYNTYTSDTVYERGFMRWDSNVLKIGTEHLGASGRDLVFRVNGSDRMTFTSGGNLTTAVNGIDISTAYLEIVERYAPSSPSANRGRIYLADVGGKTALFVLFPTGAAQQIAIEP